MYLRNFLKAPERGAKPRHASTYRGARRLVAKLAYRAAKRIKT